MTWPPIPELGDHLNHLEATLGELYAEMEELIAGGHAEDAQDVFDELVAVSDRANVEMHRLFPWHPPLRVKESWW